MNHLDRDASAHSRPARRATAQRWRAVALIGFTLIGIATSVTACGRTSAPRTGEPASSSAAAGVAPQVLQVKRATWTLPTAISRTVVESDGSSLIVAGGLTSTNASSAAIVRIDPGTGRWSPMGTLAAPVHDAGGASFGGRFWVMGGGRTTSSAAVQSFAAPDPSGSMRVTTQLTGSLPHPRSDLATSSGNGTTYVVGGYDGTTDDLNVLGTTDGRAFARVARLRLGVRYPSAAVIGHQLWVFGGEHRGAPVSTVQRIDLTTGAVDVAASLPTPLAHATAITLGDRVFLAGGRGRGGTHVSTIWSFDPARRTFTRAGALPQALSDAGSVTVDGTGYVVGGETPTALKQVTTLRLVTPATTPAPEPQQTTVGSGPSASTAAAADWLPPAVGAGHLAPGSNPAVLPSPLLIADKLNNRLVIVDPQGRVRWQFPRRGDLAPKQRFRIPDDAFFSADGKQIIVTEEDYFVVSVIDIASHRIVYRYGKPGVPGAGPNRLHNPDDALYLRDGSILVADIKNCRLVIIPPGAHRPSKVLGRTGSCTHRPTRRFDSPNGAFPMANGHYLVTEINGAWVDEISLTGRVFWSAPLPGVLYPSDSNEISPDRYLTVGYASPGQALIFNHRGKVLWRYRTAGAAGLNHPSLALPLPNGDVIVTDDYNHRVVVIDPRTNAIVWQYGHRGRAGSAAGLLNNPDGLDLMPPFNLLRQR